MGIKKQFLGFLGISEEGEAPPAAKESAPNRDQALRLVEALLEELSLIRTAAEAAAKAEAATTSVVQMVQFLSKATERSEKARERDMTAIRAHFTGETDRLASSLTSEARSAAVAQIVTELLPSLDDLDNVLSDAERRKTETVSVASLRMVRRKLRESLRRLGVEEIDVVAFSSVFDADIHEAEPWTGTRSDAPAEVASGVIAEMSRAGYRLGSRLLRAAKVSVVS